MKPEMVKSVGTTPMNRIENLAALDMILASMSKINPQSQTMQNLRRAAYLHAIVEAVLTEEVNHLPQTTEIFS